MAWVLDSTGLEGWLVCSYRGSPQSGFVRALTSRFLALGKGGDPDFDLRGFPVGYDETLGISLCD